MHKLKMWFLRTFGEYVASGVRRVEQLPGPNGTQRYRAYRKYVSTQLEGVEKWRLEYECTIGPAQLPPPWFER